MIDTSPTAHGTVLGMIFVAHARHILTGPRSKIFSLVQGMVFVGLAAGPWVRGPLFDIYYIVNRELADRRLLLPCPRLQ
jgi:hypothetical protein